MSLLRRAKFNMSPLTLPCAHCALTLVNNQFLESIGLFHLRAIVLAAPSASCSPTLRTLWDAALTDRVLTLTPSSFRSQRDCHFLLLC